MLPAPLKLAEATENKFMGLTNTDGNIVLKLLMEWGIRTEGAECNLRGDIVSIYAHAVVKLRYRQTKAIFIPVID